MHPLLGLLCWHWTALWTGKPVLHDKYCHFFSRYEAGLCWQSHECWLRFARLWYVQVGYKYYKRRKNCEFWIYKDAYCMYCYVLFCSFFIIVHNANDSLWNVLISIIRVSIKIQNGISIVSIIANRTRTSWFCVRQSWYPSRPATSALHCEPLPGGAVDI